MYCNIFRYLPYQGSKATFIPKMKSSIWAVSNSSRSGTRNSARQDGIESRHYTPLCPHFSLHVAYYVLTSKKDCASSVMVCGARQSQCIMTTPCICSPSLASNIGNGQLGFMLYHHIACHSHAEWQCGTAASRKYYWLLNMQDEACCE